MFWETNTFFSHVGYYAGKLMRSAPYLVKHLAAFSRAYSVMWCITVQPGLHWPKKPHGFIEFDNYSWQLLSIALVLVCYKSLFIYTWKIILVFWRFILCKESVEASVTCFSNFVWIFSDSTPSNKAWCNTSGSSSSVSRFPGK